MGRNSHYKNKYPRFDERGIYRRLDYPICEESEIKGIDREEMEIVVIKVLNKED